MRNSVRDGFLEQVARYEGRTTWMYQDIKGLITTGVGNLIDPVDLALDIPFLKADGSPATAAEIRAEWKRIKADKTLAKKGAAAARKLATLHLSDDAVDQLVARKRDEFWQKLLGHFSNANDWPADAQLGLLMMGWAMGPYFGKTYPSFSAACAAGEWELAAVECDIKDARPARNAAHRLCFTNAAFADDMQTLYFPETAKPGKRLAGSTG
jgi:hypothetical protein